MKVIAATIAQRHAVAMKTAARHATANSPRRGALVMLVFPDAEVLDVCGPLDILGAAGVRAPRDRRRPLLVSEHGGLVRTYPSGIEIASEPLTSVARGAIDTLLVPGGQGVEDALKRPALLRFVQRHAARARRVVSICTGSFLLAEAGLLDGRRAATHWAYSEAFRKRYPRVDLDAEAIFVNDGKFYCSAGVTAGMDLALHLVELDHGPALALKIAQRWLLYAKRPGGQSQFSTLLPPRAPSRGTLAELCAWLPANLDADLSVAALAARMAMSPRHFARVFQAELGVTPARFVEGLRIEAARRWLERGEHSVDSVAGACGLGASERLRRAFLRRLGVNPRDYRSRFESASSVPAARQE